MDVLPPVSVSLREALKKINESFEGARWGIIHQFLGEGGTELRRCEVRKEGVVLGWREMAGKDDGKEGEGGDEDDEDEDEEEEGADVEEEEDGVYATEAKEGKGKEEAEERGEKLKKKKYIARCWRNKLLPNRLGEKRCREHTLKANSQSHPGSITTGGRVGW